MKDKDQWIGVDLDGTLAEYNDWINIEHIGKPTNTAHGRKAERLDCRR
jgi:hypothetical protein